MKKIIVIIIGIVILLCGIYFIKKDDIHNMYAKHIIKDETIKGLNGEVDVNTHIDIIKEYERCWATLEDINQYDITKLIDAYIDLMNESVNIYLLRKNGKEKSDAAEGVSMNGVPAGHDYGLIFKMYYHPMLKYGFSYDITDEDVKNYNNGVFAEKLINKLKNAIDYEEKEGKIMWQINSIEDRMIELPYNAYIDYKACHKINNINFKKAVDVVFKENFSYKKNSNNAIVKYETLDGKIEERETYLTMHSKKQYIYPIPVLLDDYSSPSIELRSHTQDKRREETEKDEIYCMDDLKEQSEPLNDDKRYTINIFIGPLMLDNEEKMKGKTFEEVQEMFRNDNNLKEKVRMWMFEDEEGKEIFKEWYDKLSKEW